MFMGDSFQRPLPEGAETILCRKVRLRPTFRRGLDRRPEHEDAAGTGRSVGAVEALGIDALDLDSLDIDSEGGSAPRRKVNPYPRSAVVRSFEMPVPLS
jgi:hypothetical protein